MKILFNYVKSPREKDPKLSDFKEYIERVYETYPEAEKIFISDVEIPYDCTIIDPEIYMNKIKKITKIPMIPVRFKEYCRWMYLSENPYTLAIDLDIYAENKFPEMDDVGVYKWDECALYSGSSPEVFKDAFENRRTDLMLNNCVTFLPKNSIDLKKYLKHKKTV
jgi:hypothetical protein